MLYFRKNLDPWGMFRELEEFSRRFDEMESAIRVANHPSSPAANIYENEEGLVITVLVPGFEAENLDIKLESDILTIRGNRKSENQEEKTKKLLSENSGYSFVRTFNLPYQINSDAISAECKNGILAVNLPRAEASKARKIKVLSA